MGPCMRLPTASFCTKLAAINYQRFSLFPFLTGRSQSNFSTYLAPKMRAKTLGFLPDMSEAEPMPAGILLNILPLLAKGWGLKLPICKWGGWMSVWGKFHASLRGAILAIRGNAHKKKLSELQSHSASRHGKKEWEMGR
jgi:hypothetical protein